MDSTRRFEERQTRPSETDPAKTILVMRKFNGSEVTISGTIPHLLAAQHTILNSLHRANGAPVNVTYMGETFPGSLVVYRPKPDPFEPTEFQADFEIRRTAIST